MIELAATSVDLLVLASCRDTFKRFDLKKKYRERIVYPLIMPTTVFQRVDPKNQQNFQQTSRSSLAFECSIHRASNNSQIIRENCKKDRESFDFEAVAVFANKMESEPTKSFEGGLSVKSCSCPADCCTRCCPFPWRTS